MSGSSEADPPTSQVLVGSVAALLDPPMGRGRVEQAQRFHQASTKRDEGTVFDAKGDPRTVFHAAFHAFPACHETALRSGPPASRVLVDSVATLLDPLLHGSILVDPSLRSLIHPTCAP